MQVNASRFLIEAMRLYWDFPAQLAKLVRIEMMLCVIQFNKNLGVFQIAHGCSVEPPLPVGSNLRNGNCCQDSDDCNDDKQFDQGEAVGSVYHNVCPIRAVDVFLI